MIRLLLFMLCASASAQSFTQGALNWPNSGGGTSDPQFLYGTNGCIFDADRCGRYVSVNTNPVAFYFTADALATFTNASGTQTVQYAYFTQGKLHHFSTVSNPSDGGISAAPYSIGHLATFTFDGTEVFPYEFTNQTWTSAIFAPGTYSVSAFADYSTNEFTFFRGAIIFTGITTGTNYEVALSDELPASFNISTNTDGMNTVDSYWMISLSINQYERSDSNKISFGGIPPVLTLSVVKTE